MAAGPAPDEPRVGDRAATPARRRRLRRRPRPRPLPGSRRHDHQWEKTWSGQRAIPAPPRANPSLGRGGGGATCAEGRLPSDSGQDY